LTFLTGDFGTKFFLGQMPFSSLSSRNTLGFTFTASTVTREGEGNQSRLRQLSDVGCPASKPSWYQYVKTFWV